MINIDITLRSLTLLSYLVWEIFWLITGKKTDISKPKKVKTTKKRIFERTIYRLVWILLILQLLGLQILKINNNTVIQLTGIILVFTGLLVLISSRYELGNNWTHGAEYQIKKEHKLVTSGIYGFIRHPIYLGIILVYTGGEMVAQSYLWLLFFLILLISAYIQGKREEELLLNYFGNKYELYVGKTKMLIPFFL